MKPITGYSLAGRLGRDVLDQLHNEHGEAFHLLNLDRAKKNLRDLLHNFRSIYPNTNLGHSYKTNYVPALCRLTYEEGAYAEVVSGMEFMLANRLGIPAKKILLNGPVKPKWLLEQALHSGALVNIDSIQEAEWVSTYAERFPNRDWYVGLRCNFPMPGLQRSRFGLDVENGDLDYTVKLLSNKPGLRLEGIHCHFGGDRSVESYRYRTKKMIEISDRIFPDKLPRWMNVGGGMAGPMPEVLRSQFGSLPPSYRAYAEVIAELMNSRYGTGPDSPELIMEPGMGLFSDVQEFICRVHAIKLIGNTYHAIVAGSIYNVKPLLNTFDLPIELIPARRPLGPLRCFVISGFTCMEIDILNRGLIADLAVGDDLVFCNTGAYTVVLKPPFIETAPAIIAYEQGDLHTVRRSETLDDIFVTYTI